MNELVDPFEKPKRSKEEIKAEAARVLVEEGLKDAALARALPPEVTPAEKGWTREQAVEYGRRLGTEEADSRREIGEEREERIARAMAYAAWEYDGKPASSEAQRIEFSVPFSTVTPSLERFQANQTKPQKKK